MLEKGDIFLDSMELARIKQETNWEKMLHGLFHYVINIGVNGQTGKANSINVDPLVPIPATISEINSDLLFGEFPSFVFADTKDQSAMDEWLKEHDQFQTDILEAATYVSAMGTLFNRHFKAEDMRYDTFVKSNKVSWEEDVFGLIRVFIFDPIEGEESTGAYMYYQVEEHSYESKHAISPLLDDDRKYVVEKYKIKVKSTNREVAKIWDEEREVTDLKDMPIIKTVNQKQLGQKTGKSDYQGKEQLFAEIDNRVDQINYVLQEHVEPWMGLPTGILNEKGQINRKLGKMFEKAPIETMIRMVLFTSRISSPIAGFEIDTRGGQIESGRALKWRSVPTWAMINRKRKYWEMFFKQYFTKVEDLEKDANINVDAMSIVWKDGLPLDEDAVVENVMKQVSAGLMSKLQGMQTIREIDEKKAKKEQAVIQEEQQSKANIEASRFRVEV
jgi:hypothetical protein